jgi:hypothetical protein
MTRRQKNIPREQLLPVQPLTSTHPVLLTEVMGWTNNLEFKLCSRLPIVGVYFCERTESINPQLHGSQEGEITKPPLGHAPKFRGRPVQSVKSFGMRPKQSARQHAQHLPPSS